MPSKADLLAVAKKAALDVNRVEGIYEEIREKVG